MGWVLVVMFWNSFQPITFYGYSTKPECEAVGRQIQKLTKQEVTQMAASRGVDRYFCIKGN